MMLRPRVRAEVEERIRQELAKGASIGGTARKIGVGTGTVQRVKAELAA